VGPETSLRYPFKVTRGLLYIKPPMTYDLFCPVCNAFDAAASITWTSGRGLGPGYLNFFGSQMALAY
jgi:hypothetical protein